MTPDRIFDGFDGYQHVIDSDVDVVLFAHPPFPTNTFASGNRSRQARICRKASGRRCSRCSLRAGVRRTGPSKRPVLVSGLCWRYETNTLQLMRRLHDGAIGDITSLDTTRYAGGVWVRARDAGHDRNAVPDANWYYYTWLSGDFIVEQFVHELDRMAWVMGDQYPISCVATGGRQTYGPDKGHTFDHFAAQFVINGVKLFATTRHQRGCSNPFSSSGRHQGRCDLQKFEITGRIHGNHQATNMHQLEHDAMYAALRKGRRINNGDYMAMSTMMASSRGCPPTPVKT